MGMTCFLNSTFQSVSVLIPPIRPAMCIAAALAHLSLCADMCSHLSLPQHQLSSACCEATQRSPFTSPPTLSSPQQCSPPT